MWTLAAFVAALALPAGLAAESADSSRPKKHRETLAEAPAEAKLKPSPTKYVQVVAEEAPIVASPGGELVGRAARGTVFELRQTTPTGYVVLMHSGELRFLRKQSARPVMYRPLPIEDPALRQQVLSALVEAGSRARDEAEARSAGARRATLTQLLSDRYTLYVAQRFRLNPPVVAALAREHGLGAPQPASARAVNPQ